MDVERKQDIQFIRQFACKPLRQKEGLEIYYSILAVHFVLWKDSEVSQLGAQTSALSSHLLRRHPPPV